MDYFQVFLLAAPIVEDISGAIGLQTKILKEKTEPFGVQDGGRKTRQDPTMGHSKL